MSGNIGGIIPPDGMRAAGTTKTKTVYRFAEKAELEKLDSVELSKEVMSLRGVDGDVRMDKVMQIRRELAEGRLFSTESFDRALDRALDRIAAGG